MGYYDIQQKIIERIAAVSGVENVKAYPRRTIFPEEFARVFGVDLGVSTRIHAWLVIWSTAAPTRVGAPLNTLYVNHNFTVMGYLNWKEGAEETLRGMAENVMLSLAYTPSLGLYTGNPPTVVQDVAISIEGFRQEFLGEVLCAIAQLTVVVREYKAPVEFT